MWKNSTLFFFFYFLFQSVAFAQDEKVALPLKEVLEQIGQQHHVKFNFIEDEIVVFKIVPPAHHLNLREKINYIKNATHLKFVVTDQKYYTIYNDKKVDKPLCGYLLDQDTKQPIENAVVQIVNTNTVAASNALGYFELPIVSPNAVSFRHQSYIRKEINVKDLYVSNCPSIFLTPFSQELSEVVTTRFLTSGISKKKDGSISIAPKKLGLLPGLIEPDILQTLQQIPGISSTDETISNLNIRGGTHDQNLFLWNGIRMFQTGHFFGLISAFNPSIAHTISVTKNGSSAFFGESVSGLIDMSTHARTIEDTKSSFSTNLISSELYGKVKITPKASIEISGRRSITDFFSSPTYKNYRDRIFQNTVITDLTNTAINPVKSDEHFYFYDLTLQYQQKIGKKHELWVDAIGIRNNLSVEQVRNTIEKNSTLTQEHLGGSILWKSVWNDKNSSEIQVSSSYYNLAATNESIRNNQILDQTNAVLDFGIRVKNTHKISENVLLNAGYQLDEIGVTNSDKINTPAFSRKIKEVSITHTGIAEIRYQSTNKQSLLNFGSRINYYESFDRLIVEPRAQFNQVLSKTLSIEILAEQKSQTLSQIIDLQQDFLGIEKRRWTLANNTSIPIERSNQIGVGLAYKTPQWLITWDNFFKKVSGITSAGQGFQNQFEFSKEIGSFEVLGTELLVQRNFKKWNAWLSYSYNDNKYRFPSFSTVFFPNNFELTHVVSAAVIYEWKQIRMALGGKWHKGKPYTETDGNSLNLSNPVNPEIVYKTPNTANLPDYLQFNFSASKDWKLNSRISLQSSISILNLFNKSNIIQRYYRVNAAQDGIESVNTYSLRRTPNVNLKINF